MTRATGFADGLFSEDELQSGRIKEKELKIAYLSKIFKCVEVASGGALGVRPGKVVAGKITRAQLAEIAQVKMPDLNANDIDAATKIIEGSARAMGLDVVEG